MVTINSDQIEEKTTKFLTSLIESLGYSDILHDDADFMDEERHAQILEDIAKYLSETITKKINEAK